MKTILDYIDEYDGEEALNGKPNKFKMKKRVNKNVEFNDNKGSKKRKGNRTNNPYKNINNAEL